MNAHECSLPDEAPVKVFDAPKAAGFELLLAGALSVWFIFTWVRTIARVVRYYTAVPEFDYWRTAMLLPLYQTFNLRALWLQHNEHRIVFPEIVFASDYLLLHGRQIIPLALTFLCYFAAWAAAAWALWSDKSLGGCLRATGALLGGIVMGWEGSAAVLARPFLLEWTLSQAAVVLSLVFLMRLKVSGSKIHLAGTIISAVIATYSSGNGMLLWPILIGCSFILYIRRRDALLLVCAGAIFLGVYFIAYQFTKALSVGNVVHHPVYLLKFIGSYLSMPFGALGPTQFGAILGLASLCIVAALAIVVTRAGLLCCTPAIVLFGGYLYIVLTAVLIAFGRMDPGQTGVGNAKWDRYLVGPLNGWAIFIILCVWVSGRLTRTSFAPYAAVAAFAVAFTIGISTLSGWLRARDAESANAQLAAVEMQNDVFDPGVMLNIFPWNPDVAEIWARRLREQNLSVFYKGYRTWLGYTLSKFGRIGQASVPGEITYTFPVLDGVEVGGWADLGEVQRSRGWIVLANEAGQIVGFGRKLPAGLPPALQNLRTPASLGWAGFVNLKYPVSSFSAYVIEKKGLIPLPGSTAIPAEQVIRPEQAGAEIQNLTWQMDKSWMVNRLPQDRFYGHAPAPPIYFTWGRSADTGRITSSIFPAPGNGCLILPVLQGPTGDGLSARIVDAATDRAVASIPMQNAAQQWSFWRLPFSRNVQKLRVVAQDNGRGAGELLALGTPRMCR